MVHRLDFGGAELQLGHLARGLARLGHDVTVCCIDTIVLGEERLRDEGVDVISLHAAGRVARIAAIPRLVRLARRADVVHCTMWDASLWGRVAAVLAHRPAIVADHATDRLVQITESGARRGSWIALHNRLLDRFTYATVACASTQREMLASEGVDPRKIVHVPNGVPIDEIAEAAEAGPTRAALGIPDDAKVAMHVAVFRFEKNQLGALEAVARVRERVEDVHLVFVGDGEGREAVERRARELDAEAWVHFLGYRDDVPGLLALADLMVLPSLSDAMPMTVLEAMALGVPIVATDVGDVRRTLADDAGTCVPVGDEDALADACARALADPVLHERQSRAGRAIARRFDASTMAERYSKLFRAACAGDRSPVTGR